MERPLRSVGWSLAAGAAAAALAGAVAAQSMIATGKIVSVDSQQQVLKLKTGWFSTEEFRVTPEAEIFAGAESFELEQLQNGIEATVEYSEENGERVAQSIALNEEDVHELGLTPAAPASELDENRAGSFPEEFGTQEQPAAPEPSPEPLEPVGSGSPSEPAPMPEPSAGPGQGMEEDEPSGAASPGGMY